MSSQMSSQMSAQQQQPPSQQQPQQPQQPQQQLQQQLQQQPQQQPQQTPHQSNNEQRYDLIARVRSLVWSLKESLANLMRVSASNIQHNSQIDSGLKTSEESVARFDKALEDFFSICNQIELHLKTILECAVQARDSQMYLPFPVSSAKTDNVVDPNSNIGDNSISYNQYLITIKSQVNFAKTVHDMLIEGAKRINQMDLPLNPVIASTNPTSNTGSVV